MRYLQYSIIIVITLLFGMKSCFASEVLVQADQLYDLQNAIVWYDIPSLEGKVVRIQVKYTAATPQSEVDKVRFAPLEPTVDGSYTFYCQSSEGINIIFVCYIHNYTIHMAKIDTDYKPQSMVGEAQKVISLKSKGGYEILFTFSFNNGKMENVNIKPKVNPFTSPAQK